MTVATLPGVRRRPAALARLTELARTPSLVLAWVIVVVAIGWAVFPSVFTSASPFDGNADAGFAPPSAEHWFGTDRLGRDLFARSVYGAGTTLTATLFAVLTGFGAGSLIGLAAGFSGGWADTVLMRVVDVFLAIPNLLLAMVLVSVLGYSTNNIALAVGISSIASFARVMRAEVLAVAARDYVRAAYGLGVRRGGVVLRHIVPNAVSPVLALAALEIGSAILAVAGLGFLGYGAPPPTPEWGLLVAEGRDYVAVHPWISLLPGAALAAVVLASHRINTSFRKDHGR
ncbi:ABC transporter permease [Amycolatopsis jiangsuensis]|uniref:Peptide/nickel transport system permease protein n=1 Tax=Amycolatopsis jiangsuensis TaxID=1181879 RepID=A0A840IRT2_9PSEU|nr:ABC transporter permease [Amycolatopsis jiangsuensis]MBB4683932.1 peptide/nickel transport system permease protein [Amycolatopsis jiangsuensis]